MLLRDLIKQLQEIPDNDFSPEEVMIDVFDHKTGTYQGISPNISLTPTSDGVYTVISAKETWEEADGGE